MMNDTAEINSYQTRVATLDDFRSSRERWNQLVFSMAQPSVFLTWEWIYTWWEYFGTARRKLFVLFVYRQGELKAILPLFREGSKSLGGAFILFCGANDLYSDHLDIIAAPEDVEASLAAIFQYLSAEDVRWAALDLPMVTTESAIHGWLHKQTKGAQRSFRIEASRTSVAYYIPLHGTFDNYFASFDKKQRYNIRSRRNRLHTSHGVGYVRREPTAECLEVLADLHQRRAARKGIVSSFGQPRSLAFHKAFIARAPMWVHFRFLEASHGPIAAAYNLVFAGRVYSYQKGIDPEWERNGPGTVLLYELVEEAFAAGIKEYNFLQGAESYKSEWTGNRRDLYTLRLYNRNAAGRVASYMRGARRLLKRIAFFGHGARERRVES